MFLIKFYLYILLIKILTTSFFKILYRGLISKHLLDLVLIEHVDKFWWFGHMWSHTQPHKIESVEKLMSYMEKNKVFAIQYGIPTDSGK